MELKETILSFAQESLTSESIFIVDLKVTGKKSHLKIVLTLDGDEGISIDECAEVSRELGNKLEENNVIEEAYVLEVSSPGADEQIMLPRQYNKNKGRRFEITNEEGEIIIGKLEDIKSDAILLLPEQKKKKGQAGKKKEEEVSLVEIPFNSIKKSNVIISFK